MDNAGKLYVCRDDLNVVISKNRPFLEDLGTAVLVEFEDVDMPHIMVEISEFEELFGWMCKLPEKHEIIEVDVEAISAVSLGIQEVVGYGSEDAA